MKPGNGSAVKEFTLLGLTSDPELELLLFLFFFFIYTFTVLGNLSILLIVSGSTQLHTPMYYFLTQLSILDMAYSSVTAPKLLADLLTRKKTISFSECIVQIYFFGAFGSTEFFLLAAMAFDRYAAICNPLLYPLTMTKGLCARLVAGSYIGGFLHSLIHAGCLFQLSFCGPNVMNHFACDYPVILKLSCTDISLNNLLRFLLAALVVASSLLVILVSYSYIITSILRIRTTTGRRQAASTCISHFTCVSLFYGSAFLMEVRPSSSSSEEENKIIAVIPTMVIPSLNPLIYSLRNNEVKEALRTILYKTIKKL
ncbi:olfactory receptor 5A1-like [Pleurodeles waltl]|uniref:olfactory receptor 5A1-like n=1 Tax=Pleurodeles waltl TaxID=8319 RepID=UPI003709C1E4